MDDLLREFLAESTENLLRIEQEIVGLEQNPDDKDLLGSIFRSMHTIKGTCGFLGLSRLEAVAHSAENVLGAVRDGELTLSQEVASDVLSAVDVIRDILDALERTEEEPEGNDNELVGRLDAWLAEDGERDDESLDLLFQAAKKAVGAAAEVVAQVPSEPEAADAAEVALEAEKPEEAPAAEASPDEPSAPPAAAEARAASPESKDGGTSGARSVADASLRVNVGVLDRLMNLAGELVLTRNQLIQLSQAEEDSAYLTPVQQLNRVTTDLQEAVMKTRMQPVGNAWGKLPRLVRDLANASGKKIDLTMLGAETELDRQILQAIQDPLTHMVRNSADHGIESPDQRAAEGKPASGSIVLEAFHEGGHIVIEIRDDGKGLDVEAIRGKIVERGLASAEEAAQMSEHRIFEYIFEAGFSTAKQVTSVSGRGVGMDVVRRNIEKIGGTIEVASTVGVGSTFRIKIPLTLAIMSALIVGVQGQSFAVPQISVLELVRVADANRHLVEEINGALFYRLRDALLPMVPLHSVLGLPPAEGDGPSSIVVCQVGASRFGLIVDAILDTHEIVVKPVGRKVKGIREYAGTTILGDGRVIMILDVPGIANTCGVLARGQDHANAAASEDEALSKSTGTELLLFSAGVEAPRAVALSQVSRLEEIRTDDIEWADGRWVVQYRGRLLPLIPASDGIDMREGEVRSVVVFSDGETTLGLAVESIQDIVQEVVDIEARSKIPGLVGSAVVSGRTTELLDIDYYLARGRSGTWDAQTPETVLTNGRLAAHQKAVEAAAEGAWISEGAAPRLLVVDDSPFFLSLLVPVLEAGGFDVAVSNDGLEALRRMEAGEYYDAIVSDIDMPNLDGFEFAQRVMAGSPWKATPLIALTSRNTDEDRACGLEAGFRRYLMKFDQAEILAAVREVLTPEATVAVESTEAECEEVLV